LPASQRLMTARATAARWLGVSTVSTTVSITSSALSGVVASRCSWDLCELGGDQARDGKYEREVDVPKFGEALPGLSQGVGWEGADLACGPSPEGRRLCFNDLRLKSPDDFPGESRERDRRVSVAGPVISRGCPSRSEGLLGYVSPFW
jgi:hypothetical protein